MLILKSGTEISVDFPKPGKIRFYTDKVPKHPIINKERIQINETLEMTTEDEVMIIMFNGDSIKMHDGPEVATLHCGTTIVLVPGEHCTLDHSAGTTHLTIVCLPNSKSLK